MTNQQDQQVNLSLPSRSWTKKENQRKFLFLHFIVSQKVRQHKEE